MIRDWPCELRPREKLLNDGVNSLSDAELLAIILGSGTQGKSVVNLAQEMINLFGDIRGVMTSNYTDLTKIKGLGPAKYAQIAATQAIAQRSLKSQLKQKDTLDSSQTATQFLYSTMRDYEHEVFACVLLNSRNQLIRYEELFSGSIDSANIYPREVVKLVLQFNSAKVIFAHNHPSGNCQPSQADKNITTLLIKALALIDVQVVDHIIIGEATFSMAEKGMLNVN